MIRSAMALLFFIPFFVYAQEAPVDYYKNAEGLKKAALKTALHQIIGTADVLGYGSGSGKTWSGFCQVDVGEDGYYVDMYSNEKASVNGQGPGSGMNIEHSFAKSWWGRVKNQAYRDIQQLRPSNSRANSAKGSWPMAVVDGKTTYDNGSIKVGQSSSRPGGEITAWEPEDQYKGDFARIYMYMVTCYENFDQMWTGNSVNQIDNNTYPVFEDWTTQLMLKWSREDPVCAFEIERNNKVYGIQGNRNPFVDYPELAEYIWGSKMDTPWYTYVSTEPIFLSPADQSLVEVGAIMLDGSVDYVLPISARNLTADVTLSVQAPGFSLSTTQLTKEAANNGADVVITYTSSAVADVTTDLVITSGDLTTTVQLHAVAVDGIPALAASEITTTSFVAQWAPVLSGTCAFTLFDTDKTTVISGYPVEVSSPTVTYTVTDVLPEHTYYYQVSQGENVSNFVKVTTLTPISVLTTNLPDGSLDFVAIIDQQAPVKTVEVITENIKDPIVATIAAPFELSVDNANWSQEVMLPKTGGTISVRMPISSTLRTDASTLLLTTADAAIKEELTVNGVVQEPISFLEDFEQGSKSSYSKGTATCSMGAWEFNDAGLWGSTADAHHGNLAVRMGRDLSSGSYVESKFDKPNGAASLRFYAARYGNDATAAIRVLYSINAGVDWIELGQETITSTQLQEYAYTINTSSPVRVRIEKISGKRINIDDITLSDYTADGVTNLSQEEVLVTATKGAVALSLQTKQMITIYTIAGAPVYHQLLPAGNVRIKLLPGLYILRYDNAARKLLIR